MKTVKYEANGNMVLGYMYSSFSGVTLMPLKIDKIITCLCVFESRY
jgi:hypothetical protein